VDVKSDCIKNLGRNFPSMLAVAPFEDSSFERSIVFVIAVESIDVPIRGNLSSGHVAHNVGTCAVIIYRGCPERVWNMAFDIPTSTVLTPHYRYRVILSRITPQHRTF
jgi:murein endopeptidase